MARNENRCMGIREDYGRCRMAGEERTASIECCSRIGKTKFPDFEVVHQKRVAAGSAALQGGNFARRASCSMRFVPHRHPTPSHKIG